MWKGGNSEMTSKEFEVMRKAQKVETNIAIMRELEEIKAEIRKEMYNDSYFDMSGLKKAELILDKHIKELNNE